MTDNIKQRNCNGNICCKGNSERSEGRAESSHKNYNNCLPNCVTYILLSSEHKKMHFCFSFLKNLQNYWFMVKVSMKIEIGKGFFIICIHLI